MGGYDKEISSQGQKTAWDKGPLVGRRPRTKQQHPLLARSLVIQWPVLSPFGYEFSCDCLMLQKQIRFVEHTAMGKAMNQRHYHALAAF